MDTSDFEDMLFGEPSTQTISNDALEEDSEDDILFLASSEPPLLWHGPYTANWTPPPASTLTERCIPNDITLHTAERTQKPLTDRSCSSYLTKCF